MANQTATKVTMRLLIKDHRRQQFARSRGFLRIVIRARRVALVAAANPLALPFTTGNEL